MLKKFKFLALAIIVILSTISVACAQEGTSRVHGTVYYWFTLEPLKKSIVEVNTVPRQTKVAENGEYSFQLPLGDYVITAKYRRENILLYYAEENLTISKAGGDYVVDLIVFPTFDENELPYFENLIPEIEPRETGTNWLPPIAVLAGAIAVIAVLYYVKIRPKRKPAKVEAAKEAVPVKVVGLPSDLQEIIEIVRKSGGRVNQLELRKQLPYSEAKVSLMVTDLEDRGLIRKIKKGRGNILILKE